MPMAFRYRFIHRPVYESYHDFILAQFGGSTLQECLHCVTVAFLDSFELKQKLIDACIMGKPSQCLFLSDQSRIPLAL